MKKSIRLLLFLLFSTTALFTKAQERRTITGTVQDSTGAGVPNVSVLVKGTKTGVISDAQGNFKISVLPTSTLSFSSVGYATQEMPAGDNPSIVVTLHATNTTLSEVVVTALGIQRQSKSLTYSVQKVTNADLTNVKDASFVNSLTGKVAGVTVTKSSSGIGGSTRVVIRGNKSTRENQPLYVVDGVPLVNFSPAQPGDEFGQSVGFVGIDGGDGIANINPDDIESLSVLKGASAAALYGSQAANGVILITTKKGKAGKPRIDFSSEVTFDDPSYKTRLLIQVILESLEAVIAGAPW
jgi:TonB-dependent SusC/RagA subfamily outer membrane receptor